MNDLLGGRVSRFSLDALVNIATAIGRQSSHDVRPTETGPIAAYREHQIKMLSL